MRIGFEPQGHCRLCTGGQTRRLCVDNRDLGRIAHRAFGLYNIPGGGKRAHPGQAAIGCGESTDRAIRKAQVERRERVNRRIKAEDDLAGLPGSQTG